MLSFTRRPKCQFQGPNATTPPAEILAASRPSLSYQIKPQTPFPTLPLARERYLTSLATDYLCRWLVLQKDGREDTEENAFYGAIAQTELALRRCMILNSTGRIDGRAHLNTGEEKEKKENDGDKKEADAEYEVVECGGNKCETEWLHDWSLDTSRKNYIEVQQRPRIVVHFCHPCSKFGRQLVLLETKNGLASFAVPRRPAAESEGNETFTKNPALFSELLQKHKSLREQSSPDFVLEKIEQQRADQIKEARKKERQRIATQQNKEKKAIEGNIRACNNMIHRAQAMRYYEIEEAQEEAEDDDDSGSATFSDEEFPPLPRLRGSAVAYKTTTVPVAAKSFSDAVKGGPSEESDGEDEEEDEEENAESKTKVLEGERKETESAVADEESAVAQKKTESEAEKVAPVEKKKRATRQSGVEAMIPVCECTDNLEFFDHLDCRFILQWSSNKQQIHILRREVVKESAYFGFSSVSKSIYHLVASIEMIL